MKYIAVHTVGKPKVEGELGGAWKPGEIIDKDLTEVQVSRLLRAGAIRLADGPVQPSESNRAESDDQIRHLRDENARLANQVADANRKVAAMETANADMNKLIEGLQKGKSKPSGN
jgi:hypothetical protein